MWSNEEQKSYPQQMMTSQSNKYLNVKFHAKD
jgi:hypothetical protein